jgi:hypothetical protein
LFFLPDITQNCLLFHLISLNTTHCAPPTTPPPAKPTWTTAGKQKPTAKPPPITPSCVTPLRTSVSSVPLAVFSFHAIDPT